MMQIERKKLSELIPAPYNPRKISDKELEKLMRSIQEFGYVEPIIWNEATGHVVGGHQRLKALQEIGVEDAECVIINLPENKEKALNIALNKISGEWNEVKLYDILDDLKIENFDISLTGFSLDDLSHFQLDQESYFGGEIEKTFDMYRLNEYDENRVVGYYQLPTLKVCHYIPENLIGFNYIKSIKTVPENSGIHFFLDDYQFERIWKQPFEMFKRMEKFQCVITPDFSTYSDMPMAMRIWNLYRIRLIGQMMQDHGFNVIPHIRHLGIDTLEWCLEGIEAGGVILISLIKTVDDDFKDELDCVIKKLTPECIIFFGSKEKWKNIQYDFGNTKVKFIESRKWEKQCQKKD